jgi:hypothetical protein
LLTVNLVGCCGCIGTEAGLETPKFLAGLGIEGAKETVGPAVEN